MNRCLQQIFCCFPALAGALLAVLLLPAAGFAHGEVAGGGVQLIERIVQGESGEYRVVMMCSPALPTAGKPANIELTVMRRLPVPDPLLGSEVPVTLLPEGSLVYAESGRTLDPELHVHPEGEAGVWGVAEYEFAKSGSFLLRFHIPTETGDTLSVDFPVSVVANAAVFFRFWVNLAISILILGLTGMQLWRIRRQGEPNARLVRPVAVGAACLAAVLLVMNFFVLDKVLALREPQVASVPEESVTANEDGSYTIPTAIQSQLGIVLADAKQIPVEQTFQAFGVVEPKASNVASIVAPIWGRIEFADKPLAVGDKVERGQELVRMILELSQLERFPMEAKQHDIRGALQKAKERLEAAQIEYERAEKLFAANPAYEQDLQWAKELLDDATNAHEQISREDKNYVSIIEWRDPRKTPVVSPISGTITSIDFTPGQLAMIGEFRPLFTVVDTSEVWARAGVFLYDAGKLKIGQAVRVYDERHPDKPLPGKVHYIDDRVDAASRTLSVIVDIPNPNEQLRFGSFVRIEFQQQRYNAVAVPERAVVDDGTSQRVYLAIDQEVFLPVEVEMGLKKDGWWQVLSGVREGDRVIEKGAALLGSLRPETSSPQAGVSTPVLQESARTRQPAH